MCRYQALYHHEKTGYVIRCMACETIQVAYNNLVMTFTYKDFGAFCARVKKTGHEQTGQQPHHVRCLMIPSPCPGIQLLLSPGELQEFVSLLEAADTELQSLQLISLFNH